MISNPSVHTPASTLPVPSRTGIPGVTESYSCHASGTYWYYDANDFSSGPPQIYPTLINKASRVVKVWDPYVHRKDEILFRNIRSGISLRVLTLGGVTGPVPEPLNLVDFKRDIIKYSPSVDLELRFIDKGSTEEYEWFHDRYLFIDDDAYFVGHSMGGHTNRILSTALTIIQDITAVALLKNRFNAVWNNHNTVKVKG